MRDELTNHAPGPGNRFVGVHPAIASAGGRAGALNFGSSGIYMQGRLKMATKNNTKQQNPVRFRGARSDATIGSITKRIERDYKLPEGSVRLVLPSGRYAHVDGKVNNLLIRWGW